MKEPDDFHDWPASDKIDFDAIGAAIISLNGPRFVRVPIKSSRDGAPPFLHCLARHADCVNILQDEGTYSLHLYDAAFEELGTNLYALLGKETAARNRRMKMLRQAMIKTAANNEDSTGQREPQASAAFLFRIEEITRRQAKTILAINKPVCGLENVSPPFNVIRNYIFVIASLSVRQIVGVSFPDQLSFTVRILIFLRNLKVILKDSGSLFKARDDLASSANMHFWMLVISAQIAGYGEHENVLIRKLARSAIRPLIDTIKNTIKYPGFAAPGSIAESLLSADVRDQFKDLDDQQYRTQVRNILIELSIAMGGLMPLAITNILQFAFGPEALSAGLDTKDFVRKLEDPEAGPLAISEALRLNPAAVRLFRRVTKTTAMNGINLKEGDWVALVMTSAARDHRAFKDPNKYNPQLNRDYLEFGHELGAHNCFGQYMAQSISRVMIQELAAVAAPAYSRDIDGLETFLNMPDRMDWKFEHEHKPDKVDKVADEPPRSDMTPS